MIARHFTDGYIRFVLIFTFHPQVTTIRVQRKMWSVLHVILLIANIKENKTVNKTNKHGKSCFRIRLAYKSLYLYVMQVRVHYKTLSPTAGIKLEHLREKTYEPLKVTRRLIVIQFGRTQRFIVYFVHRVFNNSRKRSKLLSSITNGDISGGFSLRNSNTVLQRY